ncbi:MAG: sulfite exporter TauE/SafE family protein [Leptolyngbyaceae cyanobacterium bins.302]|nr:sulfite exporter TauE/SafE family protein [Leptolyngbyaceae cyanobacterium bins.302]
MIDLLLMAALGFLGSFGHCVGMCGPIATAFSLSLHPAPAASWQRQVCFHGLLNLGRIVSYALVGAGIGAVSSVLVAGGYLAGVGSGLRQAIAILTGLLLIWFGLVQIRPEILPKLPILHPLTQGHQHLSKVMMRLSTTSSWWTPALLGMLWGLIPCGFLYVAQLKAAETSDPWQGSAIMLAFGLGTLPTMLGVGVSAGMLSRDRRSQLYRLGGWLTLTIGILTLLRSGDMVDFTGYAALLCLMLALIARPISRLWSPLLQYRRALGVGAFVLALAHMAHMLTMGWNPAALPFLLPHLQVGGWAGIAAIGLMLPLVLTSSDRAQKHLNQRWRQLHLLSVPVYVLAVVHTILLGSRYLGSFDGSAKNWWMAGGMGAIALLTLLIRRQWFWSLFSLERFYASPK